MQMKKLTWKGLPSLGIASLGLGFWSFLSYKHNSDIDQLKSNYLSEKAHTTESIAKNVEEAFKAFYQGLRTMTLLPGVINIDRYGTNFHLDSKKAMQQIYNNTFLNVTLSEVYLLPKELNPDRIDPNTKKPEEPILTFDEFITSSTISEEKVEEKPKLEEVEIFEYRLMAKQLSYLRSQFSNRSSFKDLNVPAVMGEPVITCDNSEFSQADLDSNNDKSRLGFVYTLPVYSDSGEFHGAVSGIVRLNVLEKLIPKGSFALASKGNGYLGVTDPSPAFTSSKKSFEEGRTNSNLIYSQIKKLNVVDSEQWELWAVAPN
jgi:hypothetical protein